MIYFIIEGGDYSVVKLGYTNNISNRLVTLQTGNVRPLTLIAVIDGDYLVENLLHKLYADYKIRGEWYALSGDLLNFVKPHMLNAYKRPDLVIRPLEKKTTKTKQPIVTEFHKTQDVRNKIYSEHINESDKEIAVRIHRLEPEQQLNNLVNWVRRKRVKK